MWVPDVYDWSPLIRHQTQSKILDDFGIKKVDANIFVRTYSLRGISRPWGTSVELLSAEVQGNRPFDLVLAADCSALAGQSRWSWQTKVSVHVATMFWCRFFVCLFKIYSPSDHCIYTLLVSINYQS